MARFIEVHSAAGTSYFVNARNVRFVQQSKNEPEKCSVHFDNEHSITIGISAESFAAQADS